MAWEATGPLDCRYLTVFLLVFPAGLASASEVLMALRLSKAGGRAQSLSSGSVTRLCNGIITPAASSSHGLLRGFRELKLMSGWNAAGGTGAAGSSAHSSAGVVGTGPSSHFKHLCIKGKKTIGARSQGQAVWARETASFLLQPQAYLPPEPPSSGLPGTMIWNERRKPTNSNV